MNTSFEKSCDTIAAEEMARLGKMNPDCWRRHNNAFFNPGRNEQVSELLRAWIAYAENHFATFESHIGEDYVLGPAWADMGRSIRTLLNGDCGRLDCGNMDGILVRCLEAQGFEV